MAEVKRNGRAAALNDAGILGGAFFVATGVFFGVQSLFLDIGTFSEMGPGFFPVMASIAVAGLGVAAIAARLRSEREAVAAFNVSGLLILGCAPLLFLLVVDRLGLAPATFCVCLASCIATRESSPVKAVLTAAMVTALGMLVFSYFLGVSDPLFKFEL